FQAEDGIRDRNVTGVQACALPIFQRARTLLADLANSAAADDAGGQEVSELLLLAETVYRSGNTIPAAEVGRIVAELIEVDPTAQIGRASCREREELTVEAESASTA